MQGRIYIHRNNVNGKCYVGQTTKKPSNRWGNKGKHYLGTNKDGQFVHVKFANAILKNGWDNFEHIIIPKIYETQEELNKAEEYYIKLHDSYKNGYNMTLGGDKLAQTRVGKTHTVDAKKKIQKALSNKPKTLQHRLNSSKAQIGKKITESTRKKLSDKSKLQPKKKIVMYDVITKTEVEYNSIGELAEKNGFSVWSCKDAKRCPYLFRQRYYLRDVGSENKLNILLNKKSVKTYDPKRHTPDKAQIPWNKGKQMSEETKAKMRKKIALTDTTTQEVMIFDCMHKVAEYLGLTYSTCMSAKSGGYMVKVRYYIKNAED